MAAEKVLALRSDQGFTHQVEVQCVKVATAILTETDNPLAANRLDWARKTLANPGAGAELVFWAVIGADAVSNGADDPSKIQDTDVRAAIENALDGLLKPISPEPSKPLPPVKSVLG